MASIYKKVGSPYYWVCYHIDGKKYDKSLKVRSKEVACMNELRNLKIEDVDLLSSTFYIKKTKTKTQRLTKLSNQDCLVLNEHLLLLKRKKIYNPEEYLFPSRNGSLTGRKYSFKKD